MKFYLIPGFGEIRDEYDWLITFASKKYQVVFLDFDFKTMTFQEMITTQIEKNSIVFGFSIGGLIAYKLETEVNHGIYCSVSNVLGENAVTYRDYMVADFGEKITDEFSNMDYGIPRAKKYTVFCGDQELDPSTQKLPNLKIIKNTGHEFTSNYKRAVLEEISK
jgi:hypothetical protein